MIKLLDNAAALNAFAESEPYWSALLAADGEVFLSEPELMKVWVEEENGEIAAVLRCDTDSLVLLTGGRMPSTEMLLFVEKLLESGSIRSVHCEELTAAVLKNLHPFEETVEPLLAAEKPAEISSPKGFSLRENPPTEELFEIFVSVFGEEERKEKELWELKMKRGIAKGRVTVFSLYDGEKPAACAMIRSRIGRFGAIACVITREEYRNRGCASFLTSLCRNRVLEEGKIPVLIPADSHAQKLYEKLGFRPVSDVYEEAGIPHVLMRLEEGNV